MENKRLVFGQANKAPRTDPMVNARSVETTSRPIVQGAARKISSLTEPGKNATEIPRSKRDKSLQ